MKKCSSFILGGLIGATVALLFAPRPGYETRQALADTVKGCVDSCPISSCAQSFSAKAVSMAHEAAEGVAPSFATDSDDLREKIAAARARIAEQVAANAEADAAAASTIEAETIEEEPAAEAEAEVVAAEVEAETADDDDEEDDADDKTKNAAHKA